MVETLKIVAGVAGSIITISTCLTLFIKPIRNFMIQKIRDNIEMSDKEKLILEIRDDLKEHIEQDKHTQSTNELLGEAMLGIIRDNITKLYYKYLSFNSIPSHEKENLVKQYAIYHKMNGNSYVDVIYSEMLEWKVEK